MAMVVKLGTSCSTDKDCDAGGKCITAASNSPVLGGGAVNGYCSKDCLADVDCPGKNACIIPSGESKGECFLNCTIGPQLMSYKEELDPMKCHGREDVRCDARGQLSVCMPTCGKDSQCGARKCDPATAACVDKLAKPNGKATGASCKSSDECGGYCQGFVDENNKPTFSICAHECVLGGVSSLQETNDCGGLEKGICRYKPSKNGAGDWGACARSCTTQDDCDTPNQWCSTFFSDVKWGYCDFTSDCTKDEDCTKNQKDSKCVDTKFGKKCLDLDIVCFMKMGMNCPLAFPLGNAAPQTGAGGAGGSGAGGSGTGGSGTGGI
jgi:hypothetical protein